MKKVAIFLFGSSAYVIFLATFLYAIGFVGDFIVPKSIDSGEEGSLASSVVIDLLLLSIFAIQHSLMARAAFKKWWKPIVGAAMERSVYVLLSSMALVLMYWQWKPIKQVIWNMDNGTLAIALDVLFFVGWGIVLLSTFMINHFELFGLKQIIENFKKKQPKAPVFQVNYFYKLVRHPIMLGFLIAFWATPLMTIGHLLFTITTTLYILIAVKYLEERDLRKAIGRDYEDYQKKVPMFIPFTKKRAINKIPLVETGNNNSN